MSLTSLAVSVYRNANHNHQLHASDCMCAIDKEYSYMKTLYNYQDVKELSNLENNHTTQTMKCLRGY